MGIDASAVLTTSTLDDYMRIKVEPIFTSSVLMGGMKAHGRITYNNVGKTMVWYPKIRRRKITAAGAYSVGIPFPSRNMKTVVSLPWVTYNLGEKITKFDRLANAGSEVAIVDLVDETVSGMADDFVVDFAEKLYVDGGAAGSEELHGFETWYSVSGLVTDSRVGDPNDTYATKSTALGALGGDWSGDWPLGTGDRDYHAWSPLVVDYLHTDWTGDALWANSWQEVLNYAVAYMGRLQKKTPDVALLNTDLLRQAKDSLREQERFIATSKSTLTDVGFRTIMFENLEIADEYAVPDDVGYLLSWDQLELKSMQSDLVNFDDDERIETSDRLYAADFYGQLQCLSPAFMGKLQGISAGS